MICVDEDRELEYAIRNGVDFVQGNLICKVIKSKDVYEFLNNYKTERKAFDNKIFSLK
ncbi:unknown [Clostridium sp. CAG:1219]|nr:unknown [Clostridium sp. CAG:1219]